MLEVPSHLYMVGKQKEEAPQVLERALAATAANFDEAADLTENLSKRQRWKGAKCKGAKSFPTNFRLAKVKSASCTTMVQTSSHYCFFQALFMDTH